MSKKQVVAEATPVRTREELAQDWLNAKRRERQANIERLAIEADLVKMESPSVGTTYINLPDGEALKIYVGKEVEWDQDKLFALSTAWHEISPDVAFPFHQVLKPDSKVLSLIRERMPDLWKKFLEPAGVSETKKPSFSAK
jgi:hypothetical protein